MSLRTHAKELPHIINVYALDTVKELDDNEAYLTAADRQWILDHAP